MVFFTADQHFDHERIIEYCDRPFRTVKEMNEALIENWNSVVQKNDKVFVLGDFALSNRENIIKYGKALRGNKVLILGNHDRASKSVYLEAGFQDIIKYPILWADFYILSHAPKFMPGMGPYFNIYAHVHNDPTYKDVSSRSCCVSVERTNYTPISFTDLRKKVEEQWKMSKLCKELKGECEWQT